MAAREELEAQIKQKMAEVHKLEMQLQAIPVEIKEWDDVFGTPGYGRLVVNRNGVDTWEIVSGDGGRPAGTWWDLIVLASDILYSPNTKQVAPWYYDSIRIIGPAHGKPNYILKEDDDDERID